MNDIDLAVKNYFNLKTQISNIKILLATKGVNSDFIIEFIKKTGHIYFGENYATELKKWNEVKLVFPNIVLHFIGSFQSGNIRNIMKTCEVIESVSSLRQLEKLKHEATKQGKNPIYYAQINIGQESQKHGFSEEEITPDFSNLFSGLMCIPPARLNPEYYFKKMKTISQNLNLKNLSMGTSSDFQKAINFGSTEIRVGTIIFGERKK